MVSIILPVYNEAKNLYFLIERLFSVADSLPNFKFEFIFIDDGSSDNSYDLLKKKRLVDKRIEIIHFSRNFGSHAAISAGLEYCKGNLAIIMASDLQDPPDIIIPKLIGKWEDGYDTVWGIPESNDFQTSIGAFFSKCYYFIINFFTDIDQPPISVSSLLVDRVVIDETKKYLEKNSSILMLIAWLGFSKGSIRYKKERRKIGRSKWTYSKKVKLLLDTIISFSYLPIRFMSFIGIVSSMIGTISGLYLLYYRLTSGFPVQGWATIVILILIIGGLQMVMLGLLGEYLWRTFDESRNRPIYVIREKTILEELKNDL